MCWKELEFQLGDWTKGPSEHKVYYYIVYHSREEIYSMWSYQLGEEAIRYFAVCLATLFFLCLDKTIKQSCFVTHFMVEE